MWVASDKLKQAIKNHYTLQLQKRNISSFLHMHFG